MAKTKKTKKTKVVEEQITEVKAAAEVKKVDIKKLSKAEKVALKREAIRNARRAKHASKII